MLLIETALFSAVIYTRKVRKGSYKFFNTKSHEEILNLNCRQQTGSLKEEVV